MEASRRLRGWHEYQCISSVCQVHPPSRKTLSLNLLGVAGSSVGGLGSFWKQAKEAMDLPEQIPLERWPINRVYSPDVSINKMYVRFAGFLPHGDCFDAAAFRCANAYADQR